MIGASSGPLGPGWHCLFTPKCLLNMEHDPENRFEEPGDGQKVDFDALAEVIARTVSPDVRHNIHQAVSARNDSIRET